MIDEYDKPNDKCRACGARLNEHLMPLRDFATERNMAGTFVRMNENPDGTADYEIKLKVPKGVKLSEIETKILGLVYLCNKESNNA